jgi:hypothetical protein
MPGHDHRRSCHRIRQWACAAPVLLVLGLLPALTRAQQVNVIKNIQMTLEGSIEIELTSPTPFPVRSEVVMLRIGNQESTISRHPDDGNLNTLIFTVQPEQFARATAGERVVVQFGHDASRQWDFGPLDGALLDRVNKP